MISIKRKQERRQTVDGGRLDADADGEGHVRCKLPEWIQCALCETNP